MQTILSNGPDFQYPELPVATRAADQKLSPLEEMIPVLVHRSGKVLYFDLFIDPIDTSLVASPAGFADYALEQRFRDDVFATGWSTRRPVSELFSGEAAIAMYALRDICLLPPPFKQTADVKTVLMLELRESELVASVLAMHDLNATQYDGILPSRRIRLSFPAAAWDDKTCVAECRTRMAEVWTRTKRFMVEADLSSDIDAIVLRNSAYTEIKALELQLRRLLKEMDAGRSKHVLRSTHPFAASRAMAARHQQRRQKELGWDTWKSYMQQTDFSRQYYEEMVASYGEDIFSEDVRSTWRKVDGRPRSLQY